MSDKQKLDGIVTYFESVLNRSVTKKEIEFLKWLQSKINDKK
ncbi:hypothetical protein [Alkalihalobacterium alkalinitrilicum]|nr:hypothetical protein [Alkalihalobacterium alkalinitrilicum]